MTSAKVPAASDRVNSPAEAARRYAEYGLAVLPLHHITTPDPDTVRCSCSDPTCTSVAKHPRLQNGCTGASSDPDQVRSWWQRWPDANVGIATGPASGLFVVDVDVQHGGDRTIARMEAAHSPLITRESETGSGGAHLFFRLPDGVDITNANARLRAEYGPGVDIRGRGGYVVAPPSLHASGRRYRWCDGPGSERRFLPPPAWLVDLLTSPPPRREPRPHRAGRFTADQEHEQQMAGILTNLSRQGSGNRNSCLYWSARRFEEMLRDGAPEDYLHDLHETALRIGLTPQEIRSTLRSALGWELVSRVLGVAA